MKRFTLKIIWRHYTLGIAIDHTVQGGYSPLSSYFFWPRSDAWSQIKTELESKPWISKNDKVELLNQTTLIIDYWQTHKTTQSILKVKKNFPSLIFYGY